LYQEKSGIPDLELLSKLEDNGYDDGGRCHVGDDLSEDRGQQADDDQQHPFV
jgi:hypothetical protein